MTTKVPLVFHWTAPIAHTLGFLTFGMALLTLAGANLPIFAGDRTAFYALAAAGFLACSLGMAKTSMERGWTHPVTWIGMFLGALAMSLVAAVYFGFPLPFIVTDRAALIALTAIIGVKVGLAAFTNQPGARRRKRVSV
jgi:hypothetical protein